MHVSNLFTWTYWFSQPLAVGSKAFVFWLWGLLAMVLLGLIAMILSQRQTLEPQRKFYGRLSSCLLTMGLAALLWLWLRQGGVVILAWRFWLLIWLIVFVVWGGSILKYAVWRLPQVKREQKARESKEKYLGGK